MCKVFGDCKIKHKTFHDAAMYHKDKGDLKSSTTCALDYHYEIHPNDGERYSSRKPTLDEYDEQY